MKLHGIRKNAFGYATWGCMWERGSVLPGGDVNRKFICKNESCADIAMQSRITAYWPDGSVKWTAHTADAADLKDGMEVMPRVGVQEGQMQSGATRTEQNPPGQSGETRTEQNRSGAASGGVREIVGSDYTVRLTNNTEWLFDEVIVGGTVRMRHAAPILLLEEPVIVDENPAKVVRTYRGVVTNTTVEEEGPLFCVIKFEGSHICVDGAKKGEKKIPFLIRMTVGKTRNEIRFSHTFLYDGEEDKDFLKGIGIRVESPISGAAYNRHVKFVGEHGLFHETCVPLLSWHPRVPEGIYERQMAGERLSLSGEEQDIAEKVVADAPYWDSWRLCQDSAEHFRIKKKLSPGNCCYIDSLNGRRSIGGCAFGSENGSVLIGVRDFWEKYPAGITVRGMSGDSAEATVWFYSPDAEAFDFRHYANRGYNQVCYEGYDYKGADPVGIACTGECAFSCHDGIIPGDEVLTLFAENINRPPLYVAEPAFYHEVHAFGCWSLPKTDTPVGRWLEEQLDKAFRFYQNEVEQRGWYGIFNYGDFMHSYDAVRHQWKYDIGGYAWDNTELVPTLWLWLYFLRTGREDVFTLAEKLSKHASEVDVYHFGKYKGLGSRHNVRHWGCPCKEARIAMASHHRVLYYLTGDRRLEDIFDELKDNEESFFHKDPLGDFYEKENMVYPSHARSGPDWSSLCSNWMTEWERKNDTAYRDKITVGISDIKQAPLRLISGPDFEFDPRSRHLRYIGERTTGGCHLQICMGAPSIWMELAELLEDDEWREMIAEHGRFSLLPHEKQLAESGGLIGDREYGYPFMFTSMAAYGASYYHDTQLAKTTWRALLETMTDGVDTVGFTPVAIKNAGGRENLSEISWITTNFVSQWCLNVIMVLELIGDALPGDFSEVKELVPEDAGKRLHRA